MNIIVCIKQVPGTTNVKVNPETGTLIRDGVASKMNPYDLNALELALKLINEEGGKLKVISMGPPAALETIKEAIYMGADEGFLISDRKFGGADVLATSFTLANGIKAIGNYDLIITGKQTTDGDTAQTGPEISEHLNLPIVTWVKEIKEITDSSITVLQDMNDYQATVTMSYPCILTIEKDIFTPRLPSYKLQQKTKDKQIHILTFNDMLDKDETRYGLSGSATKVEKIFEPESNVESIVYSGDAETISKNIYDKLKELKLVGGQK